ncbi:DMT family transporter [Catellatospora sp. KI3]|uniref:DMT family transporter n=1 Tax=Catellatospora sp. KI3 TaxID=3041620 RepID=UPI0024824C95|nr:DMT family transporter [Catellatospora sp. KI3]MDI1459350.1 DMT family transporter [Catellatospora sp. KI3]
MESSTGLALDRASTTASYGRGLFFVGTAAVAWGTGGAVASVLYRTSGLGPLAVSFWRLVCGIAMLYGLRALTRDRTPVRPRDALVLGIGLAVYQTAYYGSIAYAGLAVGTVVTLGACPVVIALAARVVLRETLSFARAGYIGAALAGLVLLVGAAGAAGPDPLLGAAFGVLSAAGYAVVTIYSRRAGGDLSSVTSAAFVVAAVCVAPLAAWEGLLPAAGTVAVTGVWLLYLGAVPTALAYRLFFAGVAAVPATVTAVVTLLEPVAGVLIAVGLLGERLTVAAAAGAGLMLAAVAGLSRR